MPASPDRPPRFTWLASYPRSGNTWTLSFLSIAFKLAAGRPLAALREATPEALADPSGAFFGWEVGETWWAKFREDLGRLPSEADYARGRAEVQRRLIAQASGRVVMKTHNALALHHGCPTIDLDGADAVVLIVRDPRAVAPSFAAHFGLTLEEAAARMADPRFVSPASELATPELYSSWSGFNASWLRQTHRPMLVLRYEDLRAQPLAAFGRLAAFMGLELNETKLAQAVDACRFDRLQRLERDFHSEQAADRPFFRRGGAAGEALPAELRVAIERDHGPLMRRLGYLGRGD